MSVHHFFQNPRRSRLLTTACTAALTLGCNPGPTPKIPASPPSLTIGMVLPMTGPLADWGRSASQGAELAAAELEANGTHVTLLPPEDDQGKPEEAATAYRRAVELHHADGIIGPLTSGTAGAVGKASKDLNVPFITPSATADNLTRDYAAAFRVCYADAFQGRVLADYAREDLHASRAYLVYSKDDPYSKGLGRTFRERFADSGGTVESLDIAATERNFKLQANSIAAAAPAPDVVVIPMNYPVVAAFLRDLRAAGVSTPVLAGDAVDSSDFFSLATGAATNVYATSHWSVDDGSPKVAAFVQAFTIKFGRAPDVAAALTYDATLLLGTAWRDHGPQQSLIEALGDVRGLTGMTGTISIGPDRNPIKSVVVLKSNGTRFTYDKTVAP